MPGDLTIRGKVVRMGSQVSTAEAHVYDVQDKLV
jgi:acyl-coenzyme A thioesterase PaaI-like protein